MSDDLLRAQLRQAQDALAAATRLRQAAEGEYRAAVGQLHEVARRLLPVEWNQLRREEPGAQAWLPDRLGGWIVEAGRAKLNRLELMAGGDVGAEIDGLTDERDRLREELRRAQDALAALQAGYGRVEQQLAARDAELARLRQEVVALRERGVSGETTVDAPPSDAAGETRPTDDAVAAAVLPEGSDRDRDALLALGERGFCLRDDVARALGFKDASSGSARRVFEGLRDQGLLEEHRPQVESVGQTPYLLQLTEQGRAAYRTLTGEEPAASEVDRLLARHKSPEHVMLNLQARDALLAGGAASVDLYPRPVSLSNGGTFDVDLVAVFDGKPLYVEAERYTPGGKGKRHHKWSNYAAATDAFYVVVPNKRSKGSIISEICRWAYDHPDQAAGVTLRVCQLSEFDGVTLWQTERVLGRRVAGRRRA